MSVVERTAFIIGAGFVAEAGDLVGEIYVEHSLRGPYKFRIRHPLVRDLAQLCYPERDPAACPSVEQWLQESIDAGNPEPVQRLIQELLRADYYAVQKMVGPDAMPDNPYLSFFQVFPHADFLTFNYDSFIEGCLFALRRWFPQDGFGVPLEVELEIVREPPVVQPSQSLVLHLHGSPLVCHSEFDLSDPDRGGIQWLERKSKTDFLFDPGMVANLFFPWRRARRPATGFDPMQRRVIAPVPNKSAGLRAAFIQEVRNRAANVIECGDRAISIGYRFNPVDEGSFSFLLRALAKKENPVLHIVDPEATSLAKRVAASFPGIRVVPVTMTFSTWHRAGFRLDLS